MNNELKENKDLQIQGHENIDIVLNIISSIIGNKMRTEFDTTKLRYLFSCQAKVEEMLEGYYTEDDLIFLKDNINYLKETINQAEIELNRVEGELQ